MSGHKIFYARYPSPIGELYIAASESGITDLCINGGEKGFLELVRSKYGTAPVKDDGRFKGLFRELDAYFEGKPVLFKTPVDPKGTAFESKVWKAIAAIPAQQVRSYKWIAEKAGSPRGARAAGAACGKNPLPIIIPCHRVLASDGRIGGYTGGLDIKKKLLALEGILV
jgi:methylated-DNA-[protein]-cysteine S-methyltransferase